MPRQHVSVSRVTFQTGPPPAPVAGPPRRRTMSSSTQQVLRQLAGSAPLSHRQREAFTSATRAGTLPGRPSGVMEYVKTPSSQSERYVRTYRSKSDEAGGAGGRQQPVLPPWPQRRLKQTIEASGAYDVERAIINPGGYNSVVEKNALQRRMASSECMVEGAEAIRPKPASPKHRAAGRAETTRRRAERSRQDELIAELQDREQFLADMKAYGRLTREMDHKIRAEIADKLAELKALP